MVSVAVCLPDPSGQLETADAGSTGLAEDTALWQRCVTI